MSKSVSTLAMVSIVGSTMSGLPIESVAQESAARIDEVVVTATRREQSLQEVPLAVTALSADDLIATGITGLGNIRPGTVPGVNFQRQGNRPSSLAIAVRGVAISDAVQGTVELPVPVYIDGVFLGRAQGLGLELIEPERIEVLRGPQGQLFGRNAEGGVVQYVTRKPTGELGLNGKMSFGNYDAQRYQLSVDLPKVAGISATVTGLKHKHDGYTKVTDAPQSYVPPGPVLDPGELDAEAYRVALRWQSDDSRLLADYSYDDSDEDSVQPYTTWVPVNSGVTPFAPAPATSKYPSKTFNRVFYPPWNSEASGHALTLQWGMSDQITLKSISSYRKTRGGGAYSFGPALPAGVSSSGALLTGSFEDVKQDQTSQEFQLLGTWGQFDLTAGAIYFNEQVRDSRQSFLTGEGLVGPVSFILPAGASACVGIDPCVTGDTAQKAESDSYGLYAQGSYRPARFNDQLELTLGLRYSDDRKKALRYFDMGQGGPVNQPAKFKERRFDPAVAISYAWTADFNTYLRYATAYRAGGANVRSGSFTSFDQEENGAWELGMKSSWADGRVLLNLALFHTTIKDEQLTIQEQPVENPVLTNTANAVKDKKVKGAELEAQWLAMDGLRLGMNITYMDAKRITDVDNPFTPAVDLFRFWTIQTPKHSGSVFANYERPLPLGALGFHVSYAWMDDHHSTPGAIVVSSIAAGFERPAQKSSQMQARLSWGEIPLAAGQLSIALWANNLLDDSKMVYGYDGCAFGGGFCRYAPEPRTYGVELGFKY